MKWLHMDENTLFFLIIILVGDETMARVCNPGFTGDNCDIYCRYPSYGTLCQSECNCSDMYCDPKTGCKDGSPTLKPESSTTKTEVDLVDQTSYPAKGCPSGYTGTKCEIPCRYPAFGVKCQSECKCKAKLCNHIRGCNENVCASKKDSSHDVMIYSIVIGLLLMLTIIQFPIYFYLLYCFRIGRIFLTISFKV
uniref:Cell death abnormality protein 1-like n=1 Tax=Crassostrea virginica TaxID=6565 RepID=A0A8B8ASA1_CRAVI|nr:cell death abnormality protein 1-like [Crassostrea virginica]XP_022294288.1 cell death abnormality protein 1-like [Crassostrea virginica]